MPKIKTNRTKPPPEGFDEIEDILEEYNRKMRDDTSTTSTTSEKPSRKSCTTGCSSRSTQMPSCRGCASTD
ncbi:SPOSA6832_00873, partial [Sporobolomyces salmonicolor]